MRYEAEDLQRQIREALEAREAEERAREPSAEVPAAPEPFDMEAVDRGLDRTAEEDYSRPEGPTEFEYMSRGLDTLSAGTHPSVSGDENLAGGLESVMVGESPPNPEPEETVASMGGYVMPPTDDDAFYINTNPGYDNDAAGWGAPTESAWSEPVPSLGEGFNDPDYSATLPADQWDSDIPRGPMADGSPGGATDMDAMAAGLEGRVFEDGSIEGANGFPGLSNPDDDMLAGAEHEAAEGPAYEATEPASEEAGEPWEAFGPTLEAPEMAASEPGGMDLAAPSKTPDAGDPAARLDAGLPSESDISNAETGDVFRRILHAIGAAFTAGGGGTPTAFRSNADELAEERREGIRGRLDTKADFADTRARTESAERIANTEAETDRALDAGTTERANIRAGTMDRATDVRRTEAETRRGVAERAADLDSRMRTPASEESAMARERLRALGEGLPPALHEALADELASDQWSAYDVERMEEEGDQWWRGLLGRGATRAGGGGGGGGGSYSLDGTTNTALERLIEARGLNPDGMLPEEYIAGVGPRNARTAANSASRMAGTAEAAAERRGSVEFVDGVRVGVPFASPAHLRAATEDWDTVRRSMRNLSEVERIFADAGSLGAAAWPSTRRRIEQLITPMLGWVADNQGSGIIQPSEMERILRVVPGPDAGIESLGEWRRAVEGFRSDMLANTRMWLSDHGSSDEDIARAMTAVRTGRDLRRSGPGDVATPTDVAEEIGRGGEPAASDSVMVSINGGAPVPLARELYERRRDDPRIRAVEGAP